MVAEDAMVDAGRAAQGSGAVRSAVPGQRSAVSQGGGLPHGWEQTGRNDPCPCGSGKKFKKCHGATAVTV
jgi:preprotein translocase subunit SecA